ALVVLELGANDGLRGLPIAEIRENLTRMIRASLDAGAAVVLLGIELPINYGPQYRDGLRGIYRDLAAEFNLPLVPFLLDGVALNPDLMQDDGLHPKAGGEPKVLDNVWPVLEPAVAKLKGASAGDVVAARCIGAKPLVEKIGQCADARDLLQRGMRQHPDLGIHLTQRLVEPYQRLAPIGERTKQEPYADAGLD